MLNSRFLIRKLTPDDLDEVMAIEEYSFLSPWSRSSYLSEIANEFATYLVCDWEGQIAGYIGAWVVFEDAHITNVAVNRDFRGKGVGKALMWAVEDMARKKKAGRILLEVRPSNHPALKMYEQMGYRITGIRKDYYTDNGEDAFIMAKAL
ncbi:MAG: ribosomal protein S18-alanine N-acetyltransferase [Syntrophomonadaceae bacterium]|jgi:ribosomal-protein-alanine N-acetyltransferase